MQDNETVCVVDPGCGERLRQAREAAGLSLEEVADRLKMPLRIVRSLEEEDWSKLGAPVFVRGQLRSYARLLGLSIDTTIATAHVDPVEPPTLVTRNYTPRHKRLLEQFTRRAVYVVMTLALIVPVWLATNSHVEPSASVASLDVPTDATDAFEGARAGNRDNDFKFDSGVSGKRAERTPLIASITPMSKRRAAAPVLSLHLDEESWVKVIGVDGDVIEQGLLPAGTSRSYANGDVARMVLGNATAVQVERAGKPVDLAPYMRANVARFTVSSDGALAPADE